MTSVALATVGAFDIDDAMVQDMAVAWPKINKLSLIGDVTPLDSEISLAGLMPLAEHCPKLKSLTLAFDARSVPRKAPPSLAHRRLSHINVMNSPLQDRDAVAAFLNNIFPNLRRLVSSADKKEHDDNPWAEVSDLIASFKSARTQAAA